MKSETSCGELCQHPECWRANLRRVKDAVRVRNGIRTTEYEEEEAFESGIEGKRESDDGSLPTLKVVDVFGGLANQRIGSAPNNHSLGPNRFHHRSSSLPSLSPNQSQPQSTSCTPTFHVPRPSPVSPTAMTDYQKRMQWKKKKVQPVEELGGQRSGNAQVSVVGVHEMYDHDELSQDWKDVYITSAYLIWCQTNKRKKRKVKSTGSIANRRDPRRVAFKDVTEDMIPAAMEHFKPKRPEPRRSPTVGLPYSPSRLSCHRRLHVQHLDLTQYGLEDFKDFPKSVLAGIIEHLKPKSVAGDHELPLGLEVQRSSSRVEEHGAKSQAANQNRTSSTADNGPERSLEQTLRDESSRMLLDIDINSHFTSPDEEDITAGDGGGEEVLGNSKEKLSRKLEPNLVRTAEESFVARQGRVALPLGSVGVPSDHVTKDKLHHCTNSIPRNLDLGLTMEPCELVQATPTPTGTPAEERVTQGSLLLTRPHSSLGVNLGSDRVSTSDDRYNRYWPARGHMTSALRYSPFPVAAPAPTPISPERWGQYSRASQTREHSKISSGGTTRQIKRWETLSSVYDLEESGIETTRGPPGSPEGEVEGEELTVEPVFLTQEAPTRDPNLTPLSSRKDIEEWPQDKMIINIIENGEQGARSIRSPSPGSKTYIPQDILNEFQGDPYGRNQIHIAGQKMTGKPNIVTQPQISTEHPGYIAPGWRPPRSRTPLQFLETPSRKAPKPLRQPPAESVPKSLTVQSLSNRARQRPKSTPPRMMSPRDVAVPQVLSDSSLVSSTHDDMAALSMVVQASSPPAGERGGSIPPPPSPELLQSLPNGAAASRLDPLSEADERSSIASASVADDASQVEGGPPVANLSDVEEVNEEGEINKHPEVTKPEVEQPEAQQPEAEQRDVEHSEVKQPEDEVEGSEAVVPSNEEGETIIMESEKREGAPASEQETNPIMKDDEKTEDLNSEQEPLVNNEEQTSAKETGHDEGKEAQTQGLDEDDQSKEGVKETGSQEDLSTAQEKTETNQTLEESRDKKTEDEAAPPQPPGSPDIVSTPDFTEGLDLSLDLEAELRAAMDGLDDMDDNEGTGEKRTSPDFEAW